MNDQECQEFYEILTRKLREMEMSWIVEQVSETIRVGKAQPKKVRTYRERVDFPQLPLLSQMPLSVISTEERKPTGPETNLTTILAYNSQEKLSLLITAIDQAIVDTAEMEGATISIFEKVNPDRLVNITFVDEQSSIINNRISRETNIGRHNTSAQLRELLKELKRRI